MSNGSIFNELVNEIGSIPYKYTLQIGDKARDFIRETSEEELEQAKKQAEEEGEDIAQIGTEIFLKENFKKWVCDMIDAAPDRLSMAELDDGIKLEL